jgi:diadenosine tetraphosphatase ApaH/serine/threonine PP2A family protein phosphatase
VPGKIYVCKQCKHGFYFKAKLTETKKCVSCQQADIETLEDWEEFECPVCKKKYDTLTLQMMGDSNSIEEGSLPCKIDKNILQWIPFSDEEGILKQEFTEDKDAWDEVLRQKFEEEKKIEDEREAAIIFATMKPHKDRKRPYLRLTTAQEGEPTPEQLDKVQERQELDKIRQKRTKEEIERIKRAKKEEEERQKKQKKEQDKAKKSKGEEEKLKKAKAEEEARLKKAQEEELLKKLQAEKEEQLKIAQEQERLQKLKQEEERLKTAEEDEQAKVSMPKLKEIIFPSTSPLPLEVKSEEPIEAAPESVELQTDTAPIEPTKEPEKPILTPIEAPIETPIEAQGESELLTIPETKEEPPITAQPAKPEIIAVALAATASLISSEPTSALPAEEANLPAAAETDTSTNLEVAELSNVETSAEIEKTEGITVVIEEIAEIPIAEEHWDFYYNQKKFYDAESYLGGENVKNKIMGLLQEVNYYLFNPADIDISRPIMDEQDSGKVYFVGDTHGSVIDTDTLIRFFVERIHEAEENKEGIHIIFDGDYVDRSPVDIHNLLYIFSFALKYRKYIRLLRGNHEEITINSNYGFLRNLEIRIGDKNLVVEIERTFANIPLIHYLKGKDGKNTITLHGGIPIYDMDPSEMPEIPNLIDGLDRLDSRFVKIDDMDELSQQILWNDPAIDLPPDVFFLPSRRGLGFNFGEDVFNEWMNVNKADRLIRAHEVFLEGHMEYFNDRLFSLFSSSDYAGRKISAKILEFDFSKPWDSNWRHLTILKDLTKDGASPSPFASPF